MYLDLDGKGELYGQLFRALEAAIRTGRLPPGARLPSSRALCSQLAVSRNTVLAAYGALCSLGLATARGGSGTFVSDLPRPTPSDKSHVAVEPSSNYWRRVERIELPASESGTPSANLSFQAGETLLDVKLLTPWSRSLAYAAAHGDMKLLEPQGLAALRQELRRHLAGRRGVVCDVDDIIVLNSMQQGLALVARVLLDEGNVVALEEPFCPIVERCLSAHGAAVRACPVDASGLDPERAEYEGAKLLTVTPPHQFPSGVMLTARRRQAVLAMAEQHGIWILEEDYQGGLGKPGHELPTLWSLDPTDRVIYLNSFATTMFPLTQIGFMVVPKALRSSFLKAKALTDGPSSKIEQGALARILATGDYERHLVRSKAELRRRRAALLDALACYAPGVFRIEDSGGGTYCSAWTPQMPQTEADQVVRLARQLGLVVSTLTNNYARPDAPVGFFLRFAGLSPAQLVSAAKVLAKATRLAAHQPARPHDAGSLPGRASA